MWSNIQAVFVQVLLPVLVATGLGVLVQWRFKLHVPSLNRLNIWLLVPCFLFVRVFESTVKLADIGWIAVGVLTPMALLGVPLYALMRARQTQGGVVAAVVVGGLFYNAGNFGLPVAELLYSTQGVRFPGMESATDGPAVQALLMMLSNICIWLMGYTILAAAKGDGWQGVLGYFRLPMLYVLIAALGLRYFEMTPWAPIYNAVRIIGDACVPIMLLILGMQLAQEARWPRWRVVGVVAFLKLLTLPAMTFAVVWLLGLWPWPGAQLVIAAAAPTAVNTLLLTLELEGDADLAADCVFWTTVASAVTVTGVIALLMATTAV